MADGNPDRPGPSGFVRTTTESDGTSPFVDRLSEMFPGIDPSFVYTRLQAGRDIDQIIDELTRLGGRYPMLRDRDNRERVERMRQSFLDPTEFDVRNFLRIQPDPTAHYENQDRLTTPRYVQHARVYLHNAYPHLNDEFLEGLLEMHRNLLVPTLDFLCANGNGRAKGRNTINPKLLSDRLQRVQQRRYNRDTFEQREWPDDFDETFFRELQFHMNRNAIERELVRRQAERETLVMEAGERGQLGSCPICAEEDILAPELLHCGLLDAAGVAQHQFCQRCLVRQINTVFESGHHQITCLHECDRPLPETAYRDLISPATLAIFQNREQQDCIRRAKLPDQESCPKCPYTVINEKTVEEDSVFRCGNEDCLEQTCRKCRKPAHLPKKCEEVETDDDTHYRTFIEDRIAEAFARKCPECGVKIVKSGGCNRVVCSRCKTAICYVCRKKLDSKEAPYNHFDWTSGGSGLCPTQSSHNAVHADVAERAAREADTEYARLFPNRRPGRRLAPGGATTTAGSRKRSNDQTKSKDGLQDQPAAKVLNVEHLIERRNEQGARAARLAGRNLGNFGEVPQEDQDRWLDQINQFDVILRQRQEHMREEQERITQQRAQRARRQQERRVEIELIEELRRERQLAAAAEAARVTALEGRRRAQQAAEGNQLQLDLTNAELLNLAVNPLQLGLEPTNNEPVILRRARLEPLEEHHVTLRPITPPQQRQRQQVAATPPDRPANNANIARIIAPPPRAEDFMASLPADYRERLRVLRRHIATAQERLIDADENQIPADRLAQWVAHERLLHREVTRVYDRLQRNETAEKLAPNELIEHVYNDELADKTPMVKQNQQQPQDVPLTSELQPDERVTVADGPLARALKEEISSIRAAIGEMNNTAAANAQRVQALERERQNAVTENEAQLLNINRQINELNQQKQNIITELNNSRATTQREIDEFRSASERRVANERQKYQTKLQSLRNTLMLCARETDGSGAASSSSTTTTANVQTTTAASSEEQQRATAELREVVAEYEQVRETRRQARAQRQDQSSSTTGIRIEKQQEPISLAANLTSESAVQNGDVSNQSTISRAAVNAGDVQLLVTPHHSSRNIKEEPKSSTDNKPGSNAQKEDQDQNGLTTRKKPKKEK